MVTLVLRIAVLIVILAFGGPAMAATATGEALGVDPDAAAETRGATRTLVVGDDVFIGDRIVTDTNGLVQILFSDDTRLVVGPRSALVIDDYLLRDNGGNGKLAINALSGTFRFITGRAAKDRYVIKTPTGTIGVRGTALDIFATDLVTYILQLEGSTIDCPHDTPRDCEILDAKCELGAMEDNKMEVIGHADVLIGEDRERAKEMFRLAFSQGDLLRQFRVPGVERCLKRPTGQLPSDETGGSISDPNQGGDGKPPSRSSSFGPLSFVP